VSKAEATFPHSKNCQSFFGGFLLGEFVVDILLDAVGVGADDATAVDEEGWGASDFEEVTVGEAGVNFGGGLGRGETGLEGVLVQVGLAGEVEDLVIDVGSGDQVLLIVDVIVELPEGGGILLEGAAPGERGGACPGMNLVNGEILEDELDLRVVGQEAAESVVEVAADGAFEVGELDDGYGGFGIAEDRRFGEVELGGVFGEGILGEVGEFTAEEVAAVFGDVHFDLVGALVGFDVDVGFEEAGVPYFGGRGDGDLDIGAKSECAAEVVLDIFLQRGLCRGGLLRVGD
jgi:hypothetical protein